ncbi:MAG: bile acid:sodium symporter [Patescibacteria group bacterium]|jgi:BASS family bile acid:Na+ symporter
MSWIAKTRHFLFENQIMIVVLGIVLGIIFPKFFLPLAIYSTPLLMLIFFTSSLRLDFKEMVGYAKDWKMLALANGFMLLFLPIAMWLPAKTFSPEWATAFLITGAMPTGMTIALIADLFGGKTSLALIVTATTSLLAPLTIPLVLWFAIGRTVPIPVFSLFLNLFIVIVLPFFAAKITQDRFPKFTKKHALWWREISIAAFGILIAAIVAQSTAQDPISFTMYDAGLMVVMLLYVAILTAMAFFMVWWRSNSEKATLALCMVYLNNTLALYVATKFFPGGKLMTQMVLILLVLNVLLVPFKWIASYAVKLDKLKIKRTKKAA